MYVSARVIADLESTVEINSKGWIRVQTRGVVNNVVLYSRLAPSGGVGGRRMTPADNLSSSGQ